MERIASKIEDCHRRQKTRRIRKKGEGVGFVVLANAGPKGLPLGGSIVRIKPIFILGDEEKVLSKF